MKTTEERRIEHIKEIMDMWQKEHSELLAKFVKELSETPLYAMKWADKIFESSAKAEVARRVSVLIAEKRDLAGAMKAMQRDINSASRWPHRSTSPSSNMAHQCETAAWAEALELFVS